MRSTASASFLACLLVASLANACEWDYDTIKMERSRFPTALELITGKFLRHSTEFYEWRIQDRLKRLQSDPTNAALLDDLAVAYDKTGRQDRAIETALKIEKLHPGRYETAANLGTFCIHAGKLEEGLPFLGRALSINPDAHFGREKYQMSLVAYVLKRRKEGRLALPLAEVKLHPHAVAAAVGETYATFLRGNGGKPRAQDEVDAAVKGVLGMMRFGKHDSPILLEALGTLLAAREDFIEHDAKLLAARAFLKASYVVNDEEGRKAYRMMAERVLLQQAARRDGVDQITLAQVENDFQKELREGRDWYDRLRERELSWIQGGENPEAEFDRLHAADPVVSGMEVVDPPPHEVFVMRRIQIALVCLFLVVVAGVFGVMMLIRRIFGGRSDASPATGSSPG